MEKSQNKEPEPSRRGKNTLWTLCRKTPLVKEGNILLIGENTKGETRLQPPIQSKERRSGCY